MGKRTSGQKHGRLPEKKKRTASHIGVQNESTIHVQLKTHYLKPGSKTEAPVGRYIVDIAAGNGEIIEIQTRGFVKLRKKLDFLLQDHRVRLVYPLTVKKELVFRHPETGKIERRRTSPKKMSLVDIARELTGIVGLLDHPGFTLEVVSTHELEIRCRDGKGSWRRNGTSIVDRELVDIKGIVRLSSPLDYLRALLPHGTPETFTNRDLAEFMDIPLSTAQEVTYCLRRLGILEITSKKGNAFVFHVKDFRFIPAKTNDSRSARQREFGND
jgi:hypothetical protein